jgi:S-adenosylmethionine hydrolase
VLSPVYERETNVQVRHITVERFFVHPVSRTFHGRDVFAPVAAHLASGIASDQFGALITDYKRFTLPKPRREDQNTLRGTVLRVDRFGNLITNIRPEDAPAIFHGNKSFCMKVNAAEIDTLRETFIGGSEDKLFAIVGSSGYIEIATNRGSASEMTGAVRGTVVELRSSEGKG